MKADSFFARSWHHCKQILNVVPLVRIFLGAWLLSASLMLFMWLVFLGTHNPSVVDLGWVLSITVMGIYTATFLKEVTWVHRLFMQVLLMWAIRLGGFLLYSRLLAGYVDARYEEIETVFSNSELLNFFLNYQLQALLAAFFSFALYAVFNDKEHSLPLVGISLALILVGIIGEGVVDYQLYQFQQSGASGLCKVGLWQYSRHPNYFFELLIWVGFALPGLRSYTLLYSFITPLSLWAVMNYITIPLTERVALEKYPEYQQYIEHTNRLCPIRWDVLKDQ